MAKPEHEFFPVTQIGWTKVPGADVGMTERVLAKDRAPTSRPAFLRFRPAAIRRPTACKCTTSGRSLPSSRDRLPISSSTRTFHAGEYACRPPGMRHGSVEKRRRLRDVRSRYYSRS